MLIAATTMKTMKTMKIMDKKAPIILALDTSDLDTAISWIEATQECVSIYKLGLQFFLTFGATGVERIKSESDNEIFLDLKLHDIPNTVAGAARAVKELSPRFLTVHASGGAVMVRAAVKELPDVAVTAITVLTSLVDSDLQEIGFASKTLDTAVALAKLAVTAGARAIVCSPLEISAIRGAIGNTIEIITPGVRPSDSKINDDQVRTMTPERAISLGANYVVIGRPITDGWSISAGEMRNRAQKIAESILN